jgi:CheY-specific phosphatase CheX
MGVDKRAMADAFIKAVENVLGTMFLRTIRTIEADPQTGNKLQGDIAALIGLTGEVTGTAALRLPGGMAIRLVTDLLGIPVEEGIQDPLVRDSAGEIVNMIAGNAKLLLAQTDIAFAITLPTILTGQLESVYCKHGSGRFVLLFESVEDNAQFSLEVMLQDDGAL